MNKNFNSMDAKIFGNLWFKKWCELNSLKLRESISIDSDTWLCPNDGKTKDEKWKWGNTEHAFNVLPEPYWGNINDPSVIFININPGANYDITNAGQLYSETHSSTAYDAIASNIFNQRETEDWHRARFKWAQEIDNSLIVENGLSIELIPWHSKKSSDIAKYIENNTLPIINNINRFAKILPSTGIFKDSFIVRSAAFMDLLDKKEFYQNLHITKIENFSLAKKGLILKPISFLTIVQVNIDKDSKKIKFLVFHGGASNKLPPKEYIVLEKNVTLENFLLNNN